MGTGLRELGRKIMHDWNRQSPLRIDILLSHMHWDHIAGFPFFAPTASD
ncbi:MAG: hypothetical protein R3C97_14295 [Geminicoccaceae bacterium]